MKRKTKATKLTDKHGHPLLEGKPVHESDGKSEYVQFAAGLYRLTHCKRCGCDMAAPARVFAA